MKTIKLTPTDFLLFKQLANQGLIMFLYKVYKGFVEVEADAKALAELGY